MRINEIIELLENLKAAKSNLERIRSEYANKPSLLNFYEPSASGVVKYYQNLLEEFIFEKTGITIFLRNRFLSGSV